MDLQKTSRWKRLSDKATLCHRSSTSLLSTLCTKDGKTILYIAGKRVTVSLTTKHLGFPPQDTPMTRWSMRKHGNISGPWINGPESFVELMGSKLAKKLNISSLIAKDRMTLDGFQLWTRENFTPNLISRCVHLSEPHGSGKLERKKSTLHSWPQLWQSSSYQNWS